LVTFKKKTNEFIVLPDYALINNLKK